MDPEFYHLYSVLNSYKGSIRKGLEKIDDRILQAINNATSHSTILARSKYKMSMEMVTVLQSYLQILCTVETLAEDIGKKLVEVDLGTQLEPERDEGVLVTQPEQDEDVSVTQSEKSNPFALPQRGPHGVDFLSIVSNMKLEQKNSALDVDSASVTSGDTLIEAPIFKQEVQETSNPFNTKSLVTNPVVEVVKEEAQSFDESCDALKDSSVIPIIEPKAVIVKESDVELPPQSTLPKDEVQETSNPFNVKSATNDSNLSTTDFVVEVVSCDESKSVSSKDTSPKKLKRKKKSVTIKEPVVKPSTSQKRHVESPPPQSTLEYSAVIKLLGMSVHDRRREAEKQFENKKVKKDLHWRKVSPQPNQVSSERKAKEKITIFDIVEDEVVVGQNCVFSHVVTPSQFYLHINQELFELLDSSLNEDMNSVHQWVVNKFKTKSEAKERLGNFCIAFLPNKRKWFRVEVIDWLMSEESENIHIQLIDYGHMFYCKYEILQPMTQLYSIIPRMAIRCHLSAIYSPDPVGWPQDSIDTLIKISQMEKKTPFVTIFVHREGPSFGVDLINEKKYGGRTLGQVLVDEELAVQMTITDELDSILEEDLEECENINEAITGYDAKDEARICPFTDFSGRCFKGPRCRLEHGKLSRDGITTDKVLTVNQAFTQLSLPQNGEFIDILITGYVNTCHFYVHIIKDQSKGSHFNREFQKLTDNMNSNNVSSTYEVFKVYPGIGEVVLVKDFFNWYRGVCVGFKENDEIEVFFVDFGYTKMKKLKDIRQIKEDFLHVPFQAVECILNDYQEKKDAPKTASEEFFKSCMNLQYFKALVVDSEEPLRLRVWDSDNMDLGVVLKTCNLGQDREQEVFPSKNYPLSCN